MHRVIFACLIVNRSDPFARKEWYDVKAPAVFPKRDVGKTLCTKTTGTSKFALLELRWLRCR